jgi:hypothetical protein
VRFIVQDAIKTDLELGGDFICVNGKFGSHGTTGAEKKDQLYLSMLREYSDIPEEIRSVIEPFEGSLADAGYCNFLSTEQRIKGKYNYWTDFTGRLGFPSGAGQLRMYGNLADLLYHGATGDLVPVDPEHQVCIEALFDACGDPHEWSTIKVPSEAMESVNFNRQCQDAEGVQWSPPAEESTPKTLGSIVGCGDTIPEAVAELQKVADAMSKLPVHIHLGGLAELLEEAKEAEDQGIEMADEPIPEPDEVNASNGE